MSEREDRHRADEARRLTREPLLVEALETIRLGALVALGDVDATNADEIRKLQAKAAVTYDILVELQAVIVSGPAQEPEEPDEDETTER